MDFSDVIKSALRATRLSQEEERELWRVFSVEARSKLILSYQPIVASTLLKLKPAEAYFEDCFSEGLLALIKSVDDFKPALGVPFAAYARIRVKGAMLDLLRGHSRNRRNDDAADLNRLFAIASTGGDAFSQEMFAEILRASARLDGKERKVIESLYIEGKTRDETADQIGVSPSRISQLHARALKRIRGFIFARKKRERLNPA